MSKEKDIKQILIAIDNNFIFNNIKKDERFNFFEKDIVYKEGILEVLENNTNINTVIINNNLYSEIKFEEFIERIKEIRDNLKVIIFLSLKDKKYINFLNSNNIYSIYNIDELNENKIKDILSVEILNRSSIKTEINDLKKLIESKTLIGKEIKNFSKKDTVRKGIEKVIIFTGENNVGKTLFSTFCAKSVEKLNKKTILITINDIKKDADLLLKISSRENIISKVTENLDILNIVEGFNINFKNLCEKYEFLIFDVSIKEDIKLIKDVFLNSQKLIFIVDSSVLGINKATLLLDKFFLEFNVNVDKIEIIFNNFDRFSLKKRVLKEIFKSYKIIGFCRRGQVKKFIKQNILKNKEERNGL